MNLLTRVVVVTHAGVATDMGIALRRVCLSVCLSVCLFVCLCTNRKTAWVINTKLGTHTLYSGRSACIDPEVRRSRSHGYEKRHGRSVASGACCNGLFCRFICLCSLVVVFVVVREVLQSAFVCLSVCLLAYLRNHTSIFHPIFCTCYLWPWLGSPLTALQYVMYFRFCGWRRVFTWANGQNQETTHIFRRVRQVAAPVRLHSMLRCYVWPSSPDGSTGGKVCHLCCCCQC